MSDFVQVTHIGIKGAVSKFDLKHKFVETSLHPTFPSPILAGVSPLLPLASRILQIKEAVLLSLQSGQKWQKKILLLRILPCQPCFFLSPRLWPSDSDYSQCRFLSDGTAWVCVNGKAAPVYGIKVERVSHVIFPTYIMLR